MISSLCLFKNARGTNQQHKLKPKIIFDTSFLSYWLLVQVGGFRRTVRTVFSIAIPLESLNRRKALSKNQHLYQLRPMRNLILFHDQP